MAKRRMFSMQIVDSDAFLDMPATTQLLYFHLSMRADDEGFIGNPKRIMRTVGASDDDMKILISKRFILIFKSGVVVVKHWLIHNIIRMDRFSPTTYEQEKDLIAVKKNLAYTESVKIDGVNVVQLETKKEKPEWQANRESAMKGSSLPYSFTYKIRQAFTGKKCPICEVKMQEAIMSKKCTPTIQHNIPISAGGKHELGNISIICHNCNISLRDTPTGELNAQEVIEVWHSIGNQSSPKLSEVKLSEFNLSKEKLNELKENPKAILNNFKDNFGKREYGK